VFQHINKAGGSSIVSAFKKMARRCQQNTLGSIGGSAFAKLLALTAEEKVSCARMHALQPEAACNLGGSHFWQTSSAEDHRRHMDKIRHTSRDRFVPQTTQALFVLFVSAVAPRKKDSEGGRKGAPFTLKAPKFGLFWSRHYSAAAVLKSVWARSAQENFDQFWPVSFFVTRVQVNNCFSFDGF
jgi:hypothetical protein